MSALRSRQPGPPQLQEGALPPRVIADIGDASAGPTLIVTAAVHGNEPSGIEAAELVARELGSSGVRGRLIALRGHRVALQTGARFIERDLNRSWTPSGVRSALDACERGSGDAEDRELAELKGAVDDAIRDACGRDVVLLDLHTTSATSMPFVAVEDRVHSRRLAKALGVTAVFGIEAMLPGLLISYALPSSLAAMVFEAGRHDAPESPARHAAAIRIVLAELGMVPAADASASKALLFRACAGTPRMLEARDRHPISETDRFRMLPGFTNFQFVRKGQQLAEDTNGPILASRTGRVFMPLYQSQGEDGFFLVRKVSARFWYTSTLARLLKARRFVHLLPGVYRVPNADAFLVNPRLAVVLRRQLFATLGYRRTASFGGAVIFAKNMADYDAAVALAESAGS